VRSGGLQGVRDLGLIKSAVARPYTGYYRSISLKAAALTESLSKNHGFVDGNKRSALLALHLILDRSGYDLVVPDNTLTKPKVSKEDAKILENVEIESMILDVVEDRLSYDDLVKWFRARLRKKT
jgi:death-on-curing protein